MKNFKTIAISAGVVIILGGYIVYQKMATPTNDAGGLGNQTNNNTEQTGNTTGSGTTSTALKDGIYTGETVNAFYGNVQVKTTISGGKITNIEVLKFPNSPGYTTELSGKTLPVLTSEAIAAQSAQIDVISGATQTSEGFMKSLASTLSQAGVNQPDIQVTPPKKPGA